MVTVMVAVQIMVQSRLHLQIVTVMGTITFRLMSTFTATITAMSWARAMASMKIA